MEMKKYLLMMLVVLTGIVSSCKFDDEELWDSVDDLANRVSAMETLTKQMNSDIAAMQAIVTAVENQVAVSDVEKLTDGYILHFTNGTTATIKNGTDGMDGADGTDGEDGKDGADGTDGTDGKDAPVMGIAKENGVYYWTLTIDGETDWLTDGAGYKIPVTGADGADGEDGTSGSSGSSAKTPTLSVDKDGYWMFSYGGTAEYMKDANGKKISALGVDGDNGVAQFHSVTATEESVTIVKNDAAKTTFVLPRIKSLVFKNSDGSEADIKNLVCTGANDAFEFTYELHLKNAKYQVVDDNGVDVKVDMDNNKVSLKLKSNSITSSRVLLLFFNESTTLTSVFKFKVAPWDGKSASPELKAIEGEDNTLGIATPADLKKFANIVNGHGQVTGRATSDENSSITYKLMNDIDLNGKGWTPIGLNDATAFKGVFDGNGYAIKGLSVVVDENNTSNATGAGLFGVVENAKLKGVTLKDATVDVQSDEVAGAGLLVGCAKGTVVLEEVVVVKENESASNEVKGSQNTGSVAGIVSGSDVVIKNCEVKDANVKTADQGTDAANKASAGGVVGTLKVEASEDGSKAKVEIEGCKVDGIDLSAATNESGTTSTSMGGVVGSLNVDKGVEVEVNVSGNSVANTQVSGKNDSEEGDEVTENENSTQGTVVGNLSELDSEVAGNIIKDNEVSEDTKIENQLTVSNLQTILDMVVTSGNVNTFDVKGSVMGEVNSINVPAVGANVTLNFASLETTESSPLTITQGSGNSGNATDKLFINMVKENQYLNIQAPKTTVTLASGKYAQVHSLTAKNTLVVEKGVTIETLEVEGGSVQVFGHVVNLVRAEGVTEVIAVVIEKGGKVVNLPEEGFDITDNNLEYEGNPGEHEIALKKAARNGGSFTVTEKLRLTSPLIVESDFTLTFDNGAFWGDEGQFVDTQGWKAMVVVMPGATFTFNGGGEYNTGHKETQLSCIRMVGGSNAPSKVIINGGSLIGTYHAILIDEDCQNAEVEINGGTLSCDWWNEFHGVNIFNKSDAKITIKGGSLTSYGDTKISCIEMWGGELNISGGRFETNLTSVQEGLNVNPKVGNTLIGPAIAIAPKRDVTVNISGGTFTGEGASSLMEKIVDESLLGKVNVNLSITGGIFNAPVTSQNCQGFISGGQFKVQPKDIYLVEGKSAVLNGDRYEIVEGGDNDGDVENGTSLPSWGKENWGNN